MNNPLWDYSLAIYRLDGVAATCLELQDRFDIDVNLLLYAAWLAHLGRSLSAGHVLELEAQVKEWRDRVVKPLRELRRQLRDYTPAAGAREQLKALELGAEQEQQHAMYAFHQRCAQLPRADNPLLVNLTRVALLARPDDGGWERAIGRLASLILR